MRDGTVNTVNTLNILEHRKAVGCRSLLCRWLWCAQQLIDVAAFEGLACGCIAVTGCGSGCVHRHRQRELRHRVRHNSTPVQPPEDAREATVGWRAGQPPTPPTHPPISARLKGSLTLLVLCC